MKVRVLVDGVFFQLARTGIARFWKALLAELAQRPNLDVYVLDRGCLPSLDNITVIPFPMYHDRYSADDSFLIEKVCRHFKIDVFTSTYYTSPVKTPMFLIVYDMIPEVFNFDMSERFWQEKEIAISFSQSYLAISKNTKADLMKFYPEISENSIEVAYPGVDKRMFKVHHPEEVSKFKQDAGLQRPYYLLVGSRHQHKNYKNGDLFFDALPNLDRQDFDVLCIGGENVETESRSVPHGIKVFQLFASDEQLSLAYNGAVSLVYPSLYEGFGFPVVEAMASGCPVIATDRGSLSEVCSDAAFVIDGQSIPQMAAALNRVRTVAREEMVVKGINHAKHFEWSTTADAVERVIHDIKIRNDAGEFSDFFREWERLRDIQSSVDVLRMRV